ncbi:MAG: hypothetical protein LBN99_06345 [Oscillospiraceae bacterium]|jgi:hypothetical protein|nr:hypothetical protein [Oscillospiraceae bacterium]
MKKTAAAIVALILLSVLAIPAMAAGAESAKNRFTLARDARQDRRTEGDLVALGEDTEVSRGVGGDVFTAGRNVIITDNEKLQNVAAVGVNVNVHVKTARNIYAAGGDVDVRADGGAEGVYLTGASVTLSGKARDAYIAAGSVNISGAVAENLTVRSDNIVFGADTTVGGKVTVISKKETRLPASIDPAKVTYRSPRAFSGAKNAAGEEQRISILRRLGVIIAASGVAAAIALSLLLNARGGFWKEKAERLPRGLGGDALRGVAALLVAPAVAIGLVFTVVGAPVGVLLLVMYLVALYLAPVAAGVIAGRAIFRRMNRFASGAICVGLLWTLMSLPYLRAPVAVVSVIYGLGAMTSGLARRDATAVVYADGV